LFGHIFSKEKFGTDPEKIEAMLEALFSTIKRGVKTFLETTGYYHRFIERYTMIAKHLTRFLKCNVLSSQATPDASSSKQALLSSPILRITN
jgi:hypothetical protein